MYVMCFGLICISFVMGALLGRKETYKRIEPQMTKKIDTNRSLKKQVEILMLFLLLEKQGKSVKDFFRGYQEPNVAIYGYGRIGKLLVDELRGTNIKISFLLDKNAKKMRADYPIYTLEDKFPEVDYIIVTTDNLYEVKERIEQTNYTCDVLALIDILEFL